MLRSTVVRRHVTWGLFLHFRCEVGARTTDRVSKLPVGVTRPRSKSVPLWPWCCINEQFAPKISAWWLRPSIRRDHFEGFGVSTKNFSPSQSISSVERITCHSQVLAYAENLHLQFATASFSFISKHRCLSAIPLPIGN